MTRAASEQALAEWRDWAKRELGGADFGDSRLSQRLVQLLESFFSCPQGQITQSTGTWPAAKAAYRFFSNDKVLPEKILSPHRRSVIERAREYQVVLAAGDTTMIDFTPHTCVEGLGPLADMCHHGLMYHPTLLLTPDRVALGLLDQEIWVRDIDTHGQRDPEEIKKLPIEEKESRKWLRSLEATERFQQEIGSATQVISIFDREGDIFEVLTRACSSSAGIGFIVRARGDRVDPEAEEMVFEMIHRQREAGRLETTVPCKNGKGVRKTVFSIRYATVTIGAPHNRPVTPKTPIRLQAVEVYEEESPEDEERICWKLFTNLPVASFADAALVTSYYAARWGIEVFFRVLKSGCRTEARQLRKADRLIRALTLDAIVAWRICYLTMLGRTVPDLPCTAVLAEHEWRGLWTFAYRDQPLPKQPPRLQDAIRVLACLGGFLARAQDKEPGQTTVGRGLYALLFIGTMYQILSP